MEFFNKKVVAIGILIFLSCFIFFVMRKGLRIESNKALAVGIIVKAEYNSLTYKFIVKNQAYIAKYYYGQSHPNMQNKKKLVIYNSLNPKDNLILLNYPLDSSYKLQDNIDSLFDKSNITVPLWKLS